MTGKDYIYTPVAERQVQQAVINHREHCGKLFYAVRDKLLNLSL